MTKPPRVCVMLSGEGTNFAAIARYAERAGSFTVCGVLSDRRDAGGLARAQALGIAAEVIERPAGLERDEHEQHVADGLHRLQPDVVALAGYMRILGPRLVGAWRGRMLNVHPSLLPKYRGLHTYRRALEAGDTEHGASVHFVTEELDGGPVIAQARTAIAAADTESSLRSRVQNMEYELFPRVIEAVCLEQVSFAAGQNDQDSRVLWHGNALPAPLDLNYLREHAA